MENRLCFIIIKYDAEPWHIAWILEIIGSQYHMMEQTDEAACYYDQALRILPDTNCLLYRDLLALRSLLSYYTTNATHSTQNQLQRLLSQAESKKEFLARCLNISEVYYHEKLYDSAWVYLIQVFNESDNIDSKKQAAEWLVNISNSQGKSCELYAGFLIPFANKEENQSIVKSQLTELYSWFFQNMQELKNKHILNRNIRWTVIAISGLIFVISVITILDLRKKKNIKKLEYLIDEEHSNAKKLYDIECFLLPIFARLK